MAPKGKHYIVYNTRRRVYNYGRETITGLGLRTWGYSRDQAERMSKRDAETLAKQRNFYEVQEVLD